MEAELALAPTPSGSIIAVALSDDKEGTKYHRGTILYLRKYARTKRKHDHDSDLMIVSKEKTQVVAGVAWSEVVVSTHHQKIAMTVAGAITIPVPDAKLLEPGDLLLSDLSTSAALREASGPFELAYIAAKVDPEVSLRDWAVTPFHDAYHTQRWNDMLFKLKTEFSQVDDKGTPIRNSVEDKVPQDENGFGVDVTPSKPVTTLFRYNDDNELVYRGTPASRQNVGPWLEQMLTSKSFDPAKQLTWPWSDQPDGEKLTRAFLQAGLEISKVEYDGGFAEALDDATGEDPKNAEKTIRRAYAILAAAKLAVFGGEEKAQDLFNELNQQDEWPRRPQDVGTGQVKPFAKVLEVGPAYTARVLLLNNTP